MIYLSRIFFKWASNSNSQYQRVHTRCHKSLFVLQHVIVNWSSDRGSTLMQEHLYISNYGISEIAILLCVYKFNLCWMFLLSVSHCCWKELLDQWTMTVFIGFHYAPSNLLRSSIIQSSFLVLTDWLPTVRSFAGCFIYKKGLVDLPE